MDRLKEVDEVAYVRFASVYRQFKDIDTFMAELNKLLSDKLMPMPPVSLETGGVLEGQAMLDFLREEKDGEARAFRPLGGDG